MQDNEKKPALRFKGFTDPWEQRKLDELGTIVTGSTPSTTNDAYYADDGLLWVTPTDITKNITCESARKLSASGQKVARVVPRNTILVTCIASIGKNTMLANAGSFNQQINGLTPDENKYVPYFLLTESVLWSAKMKVLAATGTLQIINRTEFSEIKTFLPSFDEQKRISQYFEKLDTLITLHQRKYEKLVNIKKSMLDKMFPQNGASVPEIRFKGFTDPWEQRKLKELYFQLTERNTDLLPYQKTLSVATMSFKTDGNGAADTSLANYKRLRTGDIAFEGHTSKEFRYGRFVLNDVGDGIMSPRFSALRPLHEMPINFWKYYIHYEPIMRKVLVNSTKAGTMMNELVINDFLQGSILVPSMAEQQAIGRFFKQLDTLITLHQRKFEKLQNIKKSCLEKMFV